MHVLIIEDNAFNAFCLTRLLQAAYNQIQVTVVNNSIEALDLLQQQTPSLIILDGDLRVSDELHCNGPALADLIWSNWLNVSIIAWTNSELMRQAFAEIFKQYNRPFNENHCWQKIVSQKRILQSLAYFIYHDAYHPQMSIQSIGAQF